MLVGFCIMVALVSVLLFINVAGAADTMTAVLVTGYLSGRGGGGRMRGVLAQARRCSARIRTRRDPKLPTSSIFTSLLRREKFLWNSLHLWR